MNLMSQYWPCIPDKCRVVNKIFPQFWDEVVGMLPCDHKWSTFYVFCKAEATLVQRCNTNFERTWWIWHCSYNLVLTLSTPYPWYSVSWIYYPMLEQSWYNVVILYRSIDVVKTLLIWSCDFNVAAMWSIQNL